MKKLNLEGTAEAWERGELGRDATHTKRLPPEADLELDDALGLQMISIRLPKELIDDFKMIAGFHGLGYQPLMRDALRQFAQAEIKLIATQAYNDKVARIQATAKPARGAIVQPKPSKKTA